LQDFWICPSDRGKACAFWGSAHSIDLLDPPVAFKVQGVLADTSHERDPEPIDLSKLAALRRFAVSVRVVNDSGTAWTPFLWLSRILRSSYSTSVVQHLEDISIWVRYWAICHPVVLDILHWNDTFETLLADEFRNLQNLNIFVDAPSEDVVDQAVEMLENSVYVKKLRARRNLVVDIRGKHNILLFIILWYLKAFFAHASLQ